jgi:hypothetical protein
MILNREEKREIRTQGSAGLGAHRPLAVQSAFYCRPHAEGAEDAENRRGAFLRALHFSASSA